MTGLTLSNSYHLNFAMKPERFRSRSVGDVSRVRCGTSFWNNRLEQSGCFPYGSADRNATYSFHARSIIVASHTEVRIETGATLTSDAEHELPPTEVRIETPLAR